MAQHIRILINFLRLTAMQLAALGGAVAKGLPLYPLLFPSPTVDPKTLQTAVDDVVAAIAARPNTGVAGTADLQNKCDTLIVMLRKDAHYVQDNCGGDAAAVLSVGFSIASTATRTNVPVDKPLIRRIDFGDKTQTVIIRSRGVPRVRFYEVQLSQIGPGGTPGPWQSGGVFPSAGAMTIEGLTAQANYHFQVRAYASSTGYTDWSDMVSHICM